MLGFYEVTEVNCLKISLIFVGFECESLSVFLGFHKTVLAKRIIQETATLGEMMPCCIKE